MYFIYMCKCVWACLYHGTYEEVGGQHTGVLILPCQFLGPNFGGEPAQDFLKINSGSPSAPAPRPRALLCLPLPLLLIFSPCTSGAQLEPRGSYRSYRQNPDTHLHQA